MVDIIDRQRLPESDELRLEEEMISLAVKAIINRVIELGDGDIAIGMIKEIEHCMIETAFAPWIHAKKKALE